MHVLRVWPLAVIVIGAMPLASLAVAAMLKFLFFNQGSVWGRADHNHRGGRCCDGNARWLSRVLPAAL